MSIQGRVVWHDLMSTDVEASKRFYSELFGWRIQKDPNSPYNLIHVGDDATKHFGGIMQLDPAHKMPSHWVPYFATTDIDAALAKVAQAGGKTYVPKTSIGPTGWFAVAADPQGAIFSPFQYGTTQPNPELDGPPPAGHFCWDELLTPDPTAAEKFYGAVFGLGTEHMDMPDFGRYTLFLRDAKNAEGKRRQAGGMMKMPPGVPHPFWMSYVAVADCDATLAKAQKMGARPTTEPMNIPNVGRFATMLDPQMASIAILGPGK